MRRAIGFVLLLLGGVAAAAPCPKGKALLQLAHKAFSAGVRTDANGDVVSIHLAGVHCTSMRDRAPRWLLTFDADPANADPSDVLIAVVTRTAVLWEDGDDSGAGSVPSQTVGLAGVADLDGDGQDEVLYVSTHHGHEGSGSKTLVVVGSQTSSSLVVAETGTYDEDHASGHSYQCTATWRLVPGPRKTRRIEVIGSCEGNAAPEGLADLPGRQRYAWHAKKGLVKLNDKGVKGKLEVNDTVKGQRKP